MNHPIILLFLSIILATTPTIADETKPEGPPQNGKYETYYDSGALKAKERYKNGKLHGELKFFYEDGTLALEANYKNGEAEGVERSYYPNGTLKREATFKNGVMQGTLKLYDAQGHLTDEINVKDSRREGIARSFRPDKSVDEECQFKDDKRLSCSYFDGAGLLKARSQQDPNDPKRTIYLTFDAQGKVASAQQAIDE